MDYNNRMNNIKYECKQNWLFRSLLLPLTHVQDNWNNVVLSIESHAFKIRKKIKNSAIIYGNYQNVIFKIKRAD